mgnify:CR=1 FL=1
MFISKKTHLSEMKTLQDKINELETKLQTLTQQAPHLLELSKIFSDLQRLSGSMLSIQRMDPTEVYRWRA